MTEQISLAEAASILRQINKQQRAFAKLDEVVQAILEREGEIGILARKIDDARAALREMDAEVESRKDLKVKAEKKLQEDLLKAKNAADDTIHEAQRQAEEKVRKARLDAEQEIASILRTMEERRTQQAAWNDKIARLKDEHTALMANLEGQQAELQAKVDGLKAELASLVAKYQG